MQGFSVIILIIISIDDIKSLSVRQSEHRKNEVEIHDFSWPASAAKMKKIIPDTQKFIFHRAYVGNLPHYFTDEFKKCSQIEFHYGSVHSIQMNPKLYLFGLYKTITDNVTIERGKDYQLKIFRCIEINLKQIPKNINQLKKLEVLDFSNNLLETVQLEQFIGLDNLETLSLSSNNLKHIYSNGPLSLPSLINLYLDKNQLQYVDVCEWVMPYLTNIDLRANNLTFFTVNHFRELKVLEISGNPLSCGWKDRLLRKNPSQHNPYFANLFCEERSVGMFELDCPSYFHLQQQIYTIYYWLKQIEGKINSSQQDSNLGDIIETFEDQLKNLTSLVIEQQNVSNDIIEAMYRTDIERASRGNVSNRH
nr:uncharacterized protein LOC115256823 [Aedes albopictus]